MNFNIMYHVRYVIDSQSNIRSFEWSGDRDAWVKQFLLDNQLKDYNWIDLIFDGVIEYSEDEPEVVEEKKP